MNLAISVEKIEADEEVVNSNDFMMILNLERLAACAGRKFNGTWGAVHPATGQRHYDPLQ